MKKKKGQAEIKEGALFQTIKMSDDVCNSVTAVITGNAICMPFLQAMFLSQSKCRQRPSLSLVFSSANSFVWSGTSQ